MVEAKLTCFRLLYLQITEEEVRGRQTSLQSMRPLGIAMRLQATHVVEQRRAAKAPEGSHQEHHQAHPAVEEDRTGATGDERQHSAEPLSFRPDLSRCIS